MSSMKDILYYKDPYLKRLKTKVASCEPRDDKYIIVLDETIFYPEGGGQPADTGLIGAARVLDVHSKNGEIQHTTDAPVEVGSSVEISIDWDNRFNNMQHHSGEHMVSGLVYKHFGFDNIGFHMGDNFVTMDFSGVISDEDLLKIQNEANEAVFKNTPTIIDFPTSDELSKLEFRSKKEISGEVRIVRVGECDVCACCGTHVARSGEIGLIRLLSAQNNKGGTRVTMVCGKRAEADYTLKDEVLGKAAVMFSTRPENVAKNVEKLLAQVAQQKQIISALRAESFKYRAEQVVDDGKCIFLVEQGLTPDELRMLATAVAEKISTLCCVVSGDDESGYKYAIASSKINLRERAKEINSAINGRGGGSPELIQGSFTSSKEQAEEFFKNFCKIIKKLQ